MKKAHRFRIIFITMLLVVSACSTSSQNLKENSQSEQSNNDYSLKLTEEVPLIYQKSYITSSVFVNENIVYVGVGNKLSILKFANPSHYEVVDVIEGFSEDIDNIEFCQNYLFITEGKNVHIYKASSLVDAQEIAIYHSKGDVSDIIVDEDKIFLAEGEFGIQIVNINNPALPEIIFEYDTPGIANGIAVHESYLYIADGETGVQVLDTFNSAIPELITSFDTPGYSEDVVIDKGFLYIADGKDGLRIVDISNPVNLTQVGFYDTNGLAQNITVNNDFAYLYSEKGTMNVLNIGHPSLPILVGTYETNQKILDVQINNGLAFIAEGMDGLRVLDIYDYQMPTRGNFWFYGGSVAVEIEVVGDFAYLISTGNRGGFSIYNITEKYWWDCERGSIQSSDWNDISEIAISGKKAFLLDYVTGLHIVDVTVQSHPRILNTIEIPGKHGKGMAIEGNFAYIVGENLGLRIYDITDPMNVEMVISLKTEWTGEDIVIVNSIAYIAAGEDGLRVFDISNPSIPNEIGFFDTSGTALNIAFEENKIFLADGEKGLKIIDVTNPNSPNEIGFFTDLEYCEKIEVHDDFAFVPDGINGVQIIDVSNSQMPIQIGSFIESSEDLAPNTLQENEIDTWAPYDVDVSDDQIFIAYGGYGVTGRATKTTDIISAKNSFYHDVISINPGGLLSINLPTSAKDVFVDNNFLYTIGDLGFSIIDSSNLQKPYEIGHFDIQGHSLEVKNNLAYIVAGKNGLLILDISNPEEPVEIGYLDTPGTAVKVLLEGKYAYICDSGWGLRIIDISDPTNPVEVGFFDDSGSTFDIAISGNIVFLANGDRGLTILDVSNPKLPLKISSYSSYGSAKGIYLQGSYVYIACSEGLQVIDISTLTNPVEVAYDWNFCVNMDIEVNNGLAVIATGTFKGNRNTNEAILLYIYDITNPSQPLYLGMYEGDGFSYDLKFINDYVYIAAGYGGIQIVKINNSYHTSIVPNIMAAYKPKFTTHE